MNNPGVWVFGATDDDDRMMGMGIVVAYANRSGAPQWMKPEKAAWDYGVFAKGDAAASPDETISLKFEKVPGGRRKSQVIAKRALDRATPARISGQRNEGIFWLGFNACRGLIARRPKILIALRLALR